MKRKVNPEKDTFNFCVRMVGAVTAGDIKDVEFLLNNNSNLAKFGEKEGVESSVLEISLNNGDDVIATMLCEAGANIALISEEKQQQFAETIRQVNKNIKEKRDFIQAVCTNDEPKARVMLNQNQDLAHSKVNEMSVLEFTVGLGNYKMTELLLNNKASPSQYLSDYNGGLLHLAARYNNKPIYDLLVSKGADQSILDNDRKKASEIEFIGPIDWRGMLEKRRAENVAPQVCTIM